MSLTLLFVCMLHACCHGSDPSLVSGCWRRHHRARSAGADPHQRSWRSERKNQHSEDTSNAFLKYPQMLTPSPLLPPAGWPVFPPHRPLRRGWHHHGDCHGGSLWSPEGEQSSHGGGESPQQTGGRLHQVIVSDQRRRHEEQQKPQTSFNKLLRSMTHFRNENKRSAFQGTRFSSSDSVVGSSLQFLVCMVIGSLLMLRAGIPTAALRPQVTTQRH